jgi:hypothetical protein
MSAYSCCGEYNEHAPDCITIRYALLKAEVSGYDAMMKDRHRLLAEVARYQNLLGAAKMVLSECDFTEFGGEAQDAIQELEGAVIELETE